MHRRLDRQLLTVFQFGLIESDHHHRIALVVRGLHLIHMPFQHRILRQRLRIRNLHVCPQASRSPVRPASPSSHPACCRALLVPAPSGSDAAAALRCLRMTPDSAPELLCQPTSPARCPLPPPVARRTHAFINPPLCGAPRSLSLTGRTPPRGVAHAGKLNGRMATATPLPISTSEYLRTSYRPDCDYVDGVIEERNLGELDHAACNEACSSGLLSMSEICASSLTRSSAFRHRRPVFASPTSASSRCQRRANRSFRPRRSLSSKFFRLKIASAAIWTASKTTENGYPQIWVIDPQHGEDSTSPPAAGSKLPSLLTQRRASASISLHSLPPSTTPSATPTSGNPAAPLP